MKNKIIGVALGLMLLPSIVYPEFPKYANNSLDDKLISTPKCINKSLDYNLRLRKDYHSRIILDYFVCINSNSNVKDVEYYIDNIPVWSISVDSPGFGMAEPSKSISITFSHGIILESIRNFKKGVHEAKVILHNESNIESKVKTFELEEDVSAKYYPPFSSITF